MLRPIITPAIFDLRPDFVALSISVRGGRNGPSTGASESRLSQAIAAMDRHPWAEDHIEAWREAYRAFGAKPNRFPCSADALRKRVRRDGTLRPTNAVVDLYNAISIEYALPVGGEDATAYQGQPRLVRAEGSEPFATIADGVPKIETADPGEVIWADAAGVTCRRWNWRQGPRTQLTEASIEMWFVLERLAPMPVEALIEAGWEIAAGTACAEVELRLFDAAAPTGRSLS